MEYQLKKSDYEDIKFLSAITESIWKSTQALMQLEIEGKKDSVLYQKTIEKLRSSKSVEVSIYQRIGTNNEKLSAILKYFGCSKIDVRKYDVESILDDGEQDMVTTRIVNHIDQLMSLDYKIKHGLADAASKEGYKNISSSIVQNSKEWISMLTSSVALYDSIINDNYSCFLVLLEKFIQSPFYKDVKESLIKRKYHLFFTNLPVEDLLLKSNFEVPSNIYLTSYCVSDLHQVSSQFVSYVRKDIGSNIALCQISKLLSFFDDISLLELPKKVSAILRICMLRMSLLSIPEADIINLNEAYHEFLESKSYLSYQGKNGRAEQMIMDAFKYVNKDREIPVVVSFVKK